MKFKITFVFLTIQLLSNCKSPLTNYEIQFVSQITSTDASLRGLHVVDENIVWASGSKGTVLVSTNGGETWNENSVPGAEENDFRSLHAWDEKRAMVFGVAGPDFGYKTKNGGELWEVIFRDTTKGLFFNSLKFADEQNGLAVSDPIDGKFFVLRTEDGGENWERIEDIPNVEDGEANFAASNTCIEYLPSGKAWIATGGKAARVFYSGDFGKSWEVVKTPMIRGLSSSGIFSISFINDMEGVIVGGIYDQPEINQNIAAYTVDGGLTWLPSVTMPLEYRSCVQQVADVENTFSFAIGKTGCDISIDNGISWQFLNETGFYAFRAVPGEMIGFAAGAEGKISKVVFTKD